MIEVEKITKRYPNGSKVFNAVDAAEFSVKKGSLVLVVGRSGSGKSTLLSMIGGLTRPSEGTIKLDGEEIWNLSDAYLSQIRAEKIGFVFQFSGLLPTLSAIENVMVPSLFHRKNSHGMKRAKHLLDSFGLPDKYDAFPSSLSGGELKRVAIARSLMNDPEILLADEPTGDLDVDTEQQIMDIFTAINRQGKTMMIVSHNPELSVYADRVFRMDRGRITEITGQSS